MLILLGARLPPIDTHFEFLLLPPNHLVLSDSPAPHAGSLYPDSVTSGQILSRQAWPPFFPLPACLNKVRKESTTKGTWLYHTPAGSPLLAPRPCHLFERCVVPSDGGVRLREVADHCGLASPTTSARRDRFCVLLFTVPAVSAARTATAAGLFIKTEVGTGASIFVSAQAGVGAWRPGIAAAFPQCRRQSQARA